MAAMFWDSSVAVVLTQPQAILLAMMTMRKSIHVFPLVPFMGMGFCLAALLAAGAPLSIKKCIRISSRTIWFEFCTLCYMIQTSKPQNPEDLETDAKKIWRLINPQTKPSKQRF